MHSRYVLPGHLRHPAEALQSTPGYSADPVARDQAVSLNRSDECLLFQMGYLQSTCRIWERQLCGRLSLPMV